MKKIAVLSILFISSHLWAQKNDECRMPMINLESIKIVNPTVTSMFPLSIDIPTYVAEEVKGISIEFDTEVSVQAESTGNVSTKFETFSFTSLKNANNLIHAERDYINFDYNGIHRLTEIRLTMNGVTFKEDLRNQKLKFDVKMEQSSWSLAPPVTRVNHWNISPIGTLNPGQELHMSLNIQGTKAPVVVPAPQDIKMTFKTIAGDVELFPITVTKSEKYKNVYLTTFHIPDYFQAADFSHVTAKITDEQGNKDHIYLSPYNYDRYYQHEVKIEDNLKIRDNVNPTTINKIKFSTEPLQAGSETTAQVTQTTNQRPFDVKTYAFSFKGKKCASTFAVKATVGEEGPNVLNIILPSHINTDKYCMTLGSYAASNKENPDVRFNYPIDATAFQNTCIKIDGNL